MELQNQKKGNESQEDFARKVIMDCKVNVAISNVITVAQFSYQTNMKRFISRVTKVTNLRYI